MVEDALFDFVTRLKDSEKKIAGLDAEASRFKSAEEKVSLAYSGIKALTKGKERDAEIARIQGKREEKLAEIDRLRRGIILMNGSKFWEIAKTLVRSKISSGESFDLEEKKLLDYGFVPELSPGSLADDIRREIERADSGPRLLHEYLADWVQFTRDNPQRPRDWMEAFETVRATIRSATDGVFLSILRGPQWLTRRQAEEALAALLPYDRRFAADPLGLLLAPYDGEKGGVLYSKRKIEALVVPSFGSKAAEHAVMTAMAAVRKEEEIRSFIDMVDTKERERRREDARMSHEEAAALRDKEQKFRVEIQREKKKTRMRGPMENAYQQEGLSFDTFEDFGERFMLDYVQWMSFVIHGNKTLPAASYRMFKQNIGPRWDLLHNEPDFVSQRPKPDQVEALKTKYRGLAESAPSRSVFFNLALLHDVYARKKEWTVSREFYQKAADVETKSLWGLYAIDRIKELTV